MDRFERALRALAEIPFLCPRDFMLDDIISLPPGWRDHRCSVCSAEARMERTAQCWVEWALWRVERTREREKEGS